MCVWSRGVTAESRRIGVQRGDGGDEGGDDGDGDGADDGGDGGIGGGW